MRSQLGAKPDPERSVHRAIAVSAAYAWRLVAIAALLAVAAWLAGQLIVVVIALAIATLLARALSGPTRWLRRHRWPRSIAASATLVGFLLGVGGIVALIVLAALQEADSLGETLSTALDDIERWLIEDSPFDLDRADIERYRQEIGDAAGSALSSGDSVTARVFTAAEVLFAVVLGWIVAFFLLKDGDRFVRWIRALLPSDRRELADHLGRRAWSTLGGYLRGAALLGVIEATVMGVTYVLVGASLAVPIALLTFLAAFVPFVGAIVAGVIAVLVALASSGTGAALVVAAVAFALQQLDNDLLAPVIYGKTLSVHPAAVLLGIAAGGALFGPVGSILAVPTLAVVVNVIAEANALRGAGPPQP